MSKNFYCLGLMSGTSMDGIAGSIIHSNGIDKFKVIDNFYYKYENNFYNKSDKRTPMTVCILLFYQIKYVVIISICLKFILIFIYILILN